MDLNLILKPVLLLCYFELAIINTASSTYQNLNLKLCNFQLHQNISIKRKSFKLEEKSTNDHIFRLEVEKLVALSNLP